MFNRRSIFHTVYRRRTRKGETRIRIPPVPTRPIRLHGKDTVRRKELRSDEWWFILHRRGPRRERIGQDPQEARAVSKAQRRGTLPERIFLLELFKRGYREPGDFSFQSSQEGGRAEIGGLVADFLFETRKIVVQVQGPFHEATLRAAKDEEQDAQLSAMGYWVMYIDTDEVLSPAKLEAWFRRFLDVQGTRSSNSRAFFNPDALPDEDDALLGSLIGQLQGMLT
jgi:very-short-patch-repair endonuclease